MELISSARIGFEEVELDFTESGEIKARLNSPFEGFDRYLGQQLLQFSIEDGLRTGVLVGKRYEDQNDPIRLADNAELQARVSPIGEGGLKVRSITADEAWVTQVLSPFGHELISWLQHLPSARAGVSAAAQAYEFVKDASCIAGLDEQIESGGLAFVTADAKQASEHLEWCYIKPLLKGFLSVLPIPYTQYMEMCVDLLCCRTILSAEAPFKGHYYNYYGRRTVRGSLMGRPGTKTALMLSIIACHEMALLEHVLGLDINLMSDEQILSTRETRGVPGIFRDAGDDQAFIRPRAVVDLHRRYAKRFGHVLPDTSWIVSSDTIYFAEEIIIWSKELRFGCRSGTPWAPLWRREYSSHPHVDSLKVRLFSPITKVTVGKDESNPSIGKAAFFLKKLHWASKYGGYRGKYCMMQYWRFRFNRYVDWDCVLTYLPIGLGGLGLTEYLTNGPIDLFDWLIGESPVILLKALHLMATDKNCPAVIRAALLSFRTNTSYRGLLESTERYLQLRQAYLEIDTSETLSLEQLREQLKIAPNRFESMRFRDIERAARKAGYISLQMMIQEARRPDYIKETLMKEASIIDALPEKAEYEQVRSDLIGECVLHGQSLSQYLAENEVAQAAYAATGKAYADRRYLVELFASDMMRGCSGSLLHGLRP
jgi:hypothetical protein